MSMIPENRVCPDCGGYDLAGLGGIGRTLSSRCRCGDEPEDGEVARPSFDEPLRELKRTASGGYWS